MKRPEDIVLKTSRMIASEVVRVVAGAVREEFMLGSQGGVPKGEPALALAALTLATLGEAGREAMRIRGRQPPAPDAVEEVTRGLADYLLALLEGP